LCLCATLLPCLTVFLFFFFTATAPTEIYTLSLHDALPILVGPIVSALLRPDAGTSGLFTGFVAGSILQAGVAIVSVAREVPIGLDRKSTRLNSSHVKISYAVFCLKKKKKEDKPSIHMNLNE